MICHSCRTVIPAGLAVQRSATFEPRAWHKACWELRQAVEAVFVPEQRRATDEKVES